MMGRCDRLEIPKENLMSCKILNRNPWRQPNSISRIFTAAINFDGAIRKRVGSRGG